jgi:hypothetical protein
MELTDAYKTDFINRSKRFIEDKANTMATSSASALKYKLSQQIVDLKYAMDSVLSPYNTWSDSEVISVIDFYTLYLNLIAYSPVPIVCSTTPYGEDSCLSLEDIRNLIVKDFVELEDTPSSYRNFSRSVLMVSETENGILFTHDVTITQFVTWVELQDLYNNFKVKPWDRFIITDKGNQSVYIKVRSSDGKLWYDEVTDAGMERLRFLGDE